VAVLLPLLSLREVRPVRARAEFEQSRQLFLHGHLEESQQAAAQGYGRWRLYNPDLAERFQTLEAEAMVWRGSYDEALTVLSSSPASEDREETLLRLAIEAVAYTRIHQFAEAQQRLAQGTRLCAHRTDTACGEVIRAFGILDIERGQIDEAREAFLSTLSFAKAHNDKWLEATALLNLGAASLQQGHLDEAVDWSTIAYRAASELEAEDLAQRSLGNLGWAYVGMGDQERALAYFLEAEADATKLGDNLFQIKWLITEAYVYQEMGDLDRSSKPYRQALKLATQINSKEDIINSLEVLAHLSIEKGNLQEASDYIEQLSPLVRATPDRLDDLDVMLAQGKIDAARGQDQKAEAILTSVENDPDSQTSMRLGAEHELARLYEHRNNDASADRIYKTALMTFEMARQQLQHETSKLPFLANATPIYDDYIQMLIKQGKIPLALDLADHSRARTLAQGLGLPTSVQPTALNAGQIARKANATLLFYWLGRTRSYLWAVTPTKTELFPLPPQSEITASVDRYRSALLGPDDALESANEDGIALYRTLVAPAIHLIGPGSNVVILSDGALSRLNFETLIVPSDHPHYWIEDATLVSAPSLYMLASAKPFSGSARNALLLGDAVSADPDYPELPKASVEMERIEKHFAIKDETVYARERANPEAYIASGPQQYAYIHFVAHGVASQTDPLDSAIILSRATANGDSFKLYARDIIHHPIQARLVTISSCYGGGTRSYAGEGLVGLSWAFLRAGAHNVIGALWEVSDDSTPRLMDSLYQGLEQGMPPSAALRRAKLIMLHQHNNFRNPFFWAPFQIYTGL
jgi:CHAT domain-containing protein/Tfp pilus assembly protein PilF